jgi:hypothetical protein
VAWRTAVSHILTSIGALGVYREAVPNVDFDRLAPRAVERFVNEGPHIGVSVGAAILVLLLWVVVFCGVGAWRTATRDA